MNLALLVIAAWSMVSVLFAGVHHRWVRYASAAPSPMDVLRALPPFTPLPDPDGDPVRIGVARSFAAFSLN